MSGYIEAGYIAALGTLFSYGSALLWREHRLSRRRRDATEKAPLDKENKL